MLKLERSEKLVQLQVAILESLDKTQIRKICNVLLGGNYDALPGRHERDKVRELILWSNHHNLIDKLIIACNQTSSDFNWKDQWEEHFAAILTDYFSLDDLRQLAFYLGIDFEEIEGPHGIFGTTDNLSEKSKQWLSSLGVDCHLLSPEEIGRVLNKVWIENFLNFCRVEDICAQVLAICYHLHPEAFQVFGEE